MEKNWYDFFGCLNLLCGLRKWHANERRTERLGVHFHARASEIVICPHLHIRRLRVIISPLLGLKIWNLVHIDYIKK